ncbi:uncharacterized protein DS421_11g339010 [Arachis hypogaea]|nr:uncharacterized protein DS421_11g339010 [Arachis hypogaea]
MGSCRRRRALLLSAPSHLSPPLIESVAVVVAGLKGREGARDQRRRRGQQCPWVSLPPLSSTLFSEKELFFSAFSIIGVVVVVAATACEEDDDGGIVAMVVIVVIKEIRWWWDLRLERKKGVVAG